MVENKELSRLITTRGQPPCQIAKLIKARYLIDTTNGY